MTSSPSPASCKCLNSQTRSPPNQKSAETPDSSRHPSQMKPVTSLAKQTMADGKEAPIQFTVEEPKREGKRVTGKNALIALTTVLVVAIVVAGFLVGIFLMKQTTKEVSDNLVNIYRLKFKAEGEEVKETIKTDVNYNTTEINTEDKKGDQNTVFNDFKKGITLYVSRPAEGEGACYVSPMNKTSSVDPATLERYMKTHPARDEEETTTEPDDQATLRPSEEPIKDTGFLGQRINDLCRGLSIYWLYPDNQDGIPEDEENTTPTPYGTESHRRTKRGVDINTCRAHPTCRMYTYNHWIRFTRDNKCYLYCCKEIRRYIYYVGGRRYYRFLLTYPCCRMWWSNTGYCF